MTYKKRSTYIHHVAKKGYNVNWVVFFQRNIVEIEQGIVIVGPRNLEPRISEVLIMLRFSIIKTSDNRII